MTLEKMLLSLLRESALIVKTKKNKHDKIILFAKTKLNTILKKGKVKRISNNIKKVDMHLR